MAANPNKGVLVKPVFSSGNSGGLLFEDQGSYVIKDPQGNVVDTGETGSKGAEGYKIPSSYVHGGNFGPGHSIEFTPAGGGPLETYSPSGGSAGDRFDFRDGKNSSGGNGSIGTSPGGNSFAMPGFVNYNSLVAPYVSFQQSLDRAHQEGDYNIDLYHQNLAGFKEDALGLIDTDIEGIRRGVNALGPLAREQGNIDLATNINRAGQIDTYNRSRIPGYNQFNRGEVSQANEFARTEHARSVDAAGLGYRNRISDLLNTLTEQSKGNLGELGAGIDAELLNRGSEIGAASGIGSLTGAGIRAQDRLYASEKLNLALNAQAQIPGVLQQGQNTLQTQEERAPTIYGSPTQVPLNVSNVQDRVPVTPSISAGAAQQSLANEATNLSAIPASQILPTSLGAEQYNESGRYNRDLTVLDRSQDQMYSAAGAVQGGLNNDKADQIRQQQFDQYQQGLGVRQDAQGNSAIGTGIGLLGAGAAIVGSLSGGSTSGGGNPVVNGIMAGAGAIGDLVSGAADGIVNGVGAVGDAIFGDGDGRLSVNGTPVTGGGFGGFLDGVSSAYSGVAPDVTSPAGGQLNPNLTVNQPPDYGDIGSITGAPSSQLSLGGESDLTSQLSSPGPSDSSVMRQSTATVSNWNDLSPPQQLTASSDLGMKTAEDKGLISGPTGNSVKQVGQAITTLANPSTTDGQRAAAVAQAGASLYQTQFTGNVSAPTSIGGQQVVGSAQVDGGPGFQLADGSQVAQSTLVNTANTQNALSAFSILSSNAKNEDKLRALTAIGVSTAAANNIISQVAAGNSLAGLSIFNTATNWDRMNPIQQAVAITQTSHAVVGAMTSSGILNTAASPGASALTAVTATGESASATAGSTLAGMLGTAASGAAIVGGAYGAYKTIDAISKLPHGQAVKTGTLGGAASGASIGTGILPGLGTAVGAAVGAVAGFAAGQMGSGKSGEQMARDGWRSGLDAAGLISKDKEGAWNVSLADGTKYDIGKDGKFKLQNTGTNVDGKQDRFSYDVDWSNPIAVDSVPAANLAAILTGVDPTSNQGKDLYNKAVGQLSNAATSNAKSIKDVQNNFKSILKGVSPQDAAMRIESLRLGEKISEQEYGVYLDQINKIYGSDVQPTDKTEATKAMLGALQGQTKLSGPAEELLDVLTNPKKQTKANQKLQERIAEEQKQLNKGKPSIPTTVTPKPSKPLGFGTAKPGANNQGLQQFLESQGYTTEDLQFA